MEANANRSRPRAVATVVLALSLLCWTSVSAQRYAYSDDFSTDKATTDSYDHSEFLQELPSPWPLNGFLRYEWYRDGRMLTFYYGSAHDSYAWLKYRFPLDGSGGAYSYATVELSLVHDWSGYGFIQCYCSLDEQPTWAWPICGDEGPCTFEFSGTAPSDTVFIWFRGSNATVDDLAVVLSSDTATGHNSWTRIKSLFGDRSD